MELIRLPPAGRLVQTSLSSLQIDDDRQGDPTHHPSKCWLAQGARGAARRARASDPRPRPPLFPGPCHGLFERRGQGRHSPRSVAEELEAVEPHRALLAAMGCAVLVYAETAGGIAGDRT